MERRNGRVLALITRDPATGGPLEVTRLENPESGVVIEGRFSLGWIGRLTPEQLDFVGLFLFNRGNVQKLAAELNISYNTARNRLDEIVTALGAPPEGTDQPSPPRRTGIDRREVLDLLAAGEISYEEAMRRLQE